jgi:two-component sensor histidine kinase
MAHRLKNALTIVQSIAFQTIGTESVEAAKFAGRLRTLAEANELLNEDVATPTATVRDAIEAALSPFEGEKARFDLTIADGRIASQQVVSLALAIHELSTNATKYGALSHPHGRVEIHVEDLGNQLRLTWKEHDGPPVVPATEQGFGTRLLRRSGMGTEISFEPDGLRCTMGLRKE